MYVHKRRYLYSPHHMSILNLPQVVVHIPWYWRHPKYGRILLKRTKLFAHDEFDLCSVGDLVRTDFWPHVPAARGDKWELYQSRSIFVTHTFVHITTSFASFWLLIIHASLSATAACSEDAHRQLLTSVAVMLSPTHLLP